MDGAAWVEQPGSWEAPGGGRRRQPQLHNHVLPSAGCTRATSTLCTPDIVRLLVTSWSGAEDRGRDWRDSGAGGWPAAAGRRPEQPRLLPASVGGTSPPGKHPAAHSAQASEDTQATDFRSDNPRQEEARLVARELKTWSASQLQQPLEAASASSSEIGATSTTGGLLPEQEPKMNLIQLQSHHLQHQTGPDQMGSLK